MEPGHRVSNLGPGLRTIIIIIIIIIRKDKFILP